MPQPRRQRAFLLLGLLAGLTLSCAGPGPRPAAQADSSPSAFLDEMRVEAFGAQRSVLKLELRVDNPGPPLSLESLTYELLAEERGLAAGDLRLSAAAPASGSVKLPIRLEVAYLDLPYRAREQIRRGAPVSLVVRGRLAGHSALDEVVLEFDGEAQAAAGASAP